MLATPFRPGPGASSWLARLLDRRGLDGVLSGRETQARLELEFARADRSDQGLAIVHFHARDKADLSKALRLLAEVLVDRRRLSDAVGTLRPEQICALLPNTSRNGARAFATDVMIRCRQRGPYSFGYSIEVHQPGRRTGGSGDSNGAFENGAFEKEEVAPPLGGRTSELADTRGGRSVACAAFLPSVEGALLPDAMLVPLPLWKRAMDIVASGALLLLSLPIQIAVVIAIKATSPGPVIYRQKRAGQGGKPFDFYKFRSMYVDADKRKAELLPLNEMRNSPAFKMKDDPRITPVGRWLRRWSIDELPQLWNVLKGDMTLVGPRPPTLDEIPQYEPWQYRRLATKGGLTCIWQVSGRSNIEFLEWVRMDLRYIQRRCLSLDLAILAKTTIVVLSGRGAY
jgi:lipopolysaccharide/colanic/teichoic acid biosynthesis glycosyltransferase